MTIHQIKVTRLFKALYTGIPVKIGELTFKYFNKGEIVYKDGPNNYQAEETGIYMYKDNNEKHILYGSQFLFLIDLANKLTDEEFITLSNNDSLNNEKI